MPRNRTRIVALAALLVVWSFASARDAAAQDTGGDGILRIGLREFDTTNTAKFTADATKFLGRFQQTNQWSKVEKLATACRQHPDRDLQALGAWYLTLILGQESADSPEARAALLKSLAEAVQLGYRNPQAIESAEQLVIIRDTAEFKALVAGLEAELEEEMRVDFRAWLTAEFARNRKAAEGAPADPWSLATVKSLGGEPIWRAGEPSVVVLSRIHHDGFSKLLPRLAEAIRQKAPETDVSVLFYQYFADDAGRLRQTEAYVEETLGALSLEWKCAVVGREGYETITGDLESRGPEDSAESVFLPVTVVLDKAGVPVLTYAGVLFDWQAAGVAALIGELPADPPPPLPVDDAADAADDDQPAAADAPAGDDPAAPQKDPEKPLEPAPEKDSDPPPVEDEPVEDEPAPDPKPEAPPPEKDSDPPVPEDDDADDPVPDDPVPDDPGDDEPAPEEDDGTPPPEEDSDPPPVEDEPTPDEPAPEEDGDSPPVEDDPAPEDSEEPGSE